MTWYAAYELETGRLMSVGTEVADPIPEGYGVIEVEAEEQPDARKWDPKTQQFR